MKDLLVIVNLCLYTAAASSSYRDSVGFSAVVVAQTTAQNDLSGSFEMDLTEQFYEMTRDSRVAEAAVALAELEKKSPCARQATVRFMTLFKNHEKHPDYSTAESDLQIENLEASYAVNLAFCELKKGGISLPRECLPVTVGVTGLLPAAHSSEATYINEALVETCIHSLNKDGTHWTSYSNSQKQASIIRQGARASIEMDQWIQLHQKTGKLSEKTMSLMADKVRMLNEHLERACSLLAESLEVHDRKLHSFVNRVHNMMSSVFGGALAEATGLSNMLLETLTRVREGLINAEEASDRAQSTLRNVTDSTLEILAAQFEVKDGAQLALQSTTNLRDFLSSLAEQVEALGGNIDNLLIRQDMLEEQSAQTLVNIQNINGEVDAVVEAVENLKGAASNLQDTIEATIIAASGWSNNFFASDGFSGVSWPAIIGCPLLVLSLGSYGFPIVIHSAGLLLSGLVVAVVGAKIFSSPLWQFSQLNQRLPSSFTHQARDKKSQLVTYNNSLELSSVKGTVLLDQRTPPEWEIEERTGDIEK